MKTKKKLSEQALLKSFAKGEWHSVSDEDQEIKRSSRSARLQLKALKKEARISLRLNLTDLEMIRTKATHAGLPYQTLLSSVIHQFATNQLVLSQELDNRLRRVIREELEET